MITMNWSGQPVPETYLFPHKHSSPAQRNDDGVDPSSVPCIRYRLFDGYSFEFEQRAIGQGGHLKTGTGQGLSDKVVGVDGVNGGEVADIGQGDGGLPHFGGFTCDQNQSKLAGVVHRLPASLA